MRTKLTSLTLIVAFVLPTAAVFAQAVPPPATGAPVVPSMCGGIQGIICPSGYRCQLDGNYPDASGKCIAERGRVIREQVQNLRQNVQQNAQEIRERAEEFRAEAKTLRDGLLQKREEFRATIETKKQELKTRIQEEHERLEERLQNIKDERKKNIVEGLDQRLKEVLQNRVNHFNDIIGKIGQALERIIARTQEVAAGGKDVASITPLIEKARTAIADAQAAITAQAGKSYDLTITDEATLRTTIGRIRQNLENDLKAVRDKIKAAHEAVRQAAVALGRLNAATSDGTEPAEGSDAISPAIPPGPPAPATQAPLPRGNN